MEKLKEKILYLLIIAIIFWISIIAVICFNIDMTIPKNLPEDDSNYFEIVFENDTVIHK